MATTTINRSRREHFIDCLKRTVRLKRREDKQLMLLPPISLGQSQDWCAKDIGYLNWSLLHKDVVSGMSEEQFEGAFLDRLEATGKFPKFFRRRK